MIGAKEIASRLKIARVNKGYRTARKFAKVHNIAESTYAQHESGTRKLNTATLINYSRKLNVNPAWILHGKEPIMIDLKYLEYGDGYEKYITASVPIILIILKMLIPKIHNKQITSHSDLNKIVCRIHDEIKKHDFDMQIIQNIM